MKRAISVLLFFVLISNMFAFALADAAVPYASTVFNDTELSVNQSSGKITALARVYSNGTATQLGVKSITIQVYNGGSWKAAYTASGLYGYNISSYSKTFKCNAISGKRYRAKVTFYGKVNGVSESHSMTTDPITAS